MKRCALGSSLLVLAALAACDSGSAVLVPGGDPERGRQAIDRYGCGGCHTIPGIRRADAKVGPPLENLRYRTYIAGVLTNSPDNLALWIEHPRSVDPRTAMPEMGVSAKEARDIAAYLYSR